MVKATVTFAVLYMTGITDLTAAVECPIVSGDAMGSVKVPDRDTIDANCCDAMKSFIIGSMARAQEPPMPWAVLAGTVGVQECSVTGYAATLGQCGEDPVYVANDATMAALGADLCAKKDTCNTEGIVGDGVLAAMADDFNKDGFITMVCGIGENAPAPAPPAEGPAAPAPAAPAPAAPAPPDAPATPAAPTPPDAPATPAPPAQTAAPTNMEVSADDGDMNGCNDKNVMWYLTFGLLALSGARA